MGKRVADMTPEERERKRTYGAAYRAAQSAFMAYRRQVKEPQPERTAEPKPKTSPYEKALKACLRLPPKERHTLLENLVMMLEAGQ